MSAILKSVGPARYAELVAKAVRILTSLDLMDMNGHVSARDADDPERMYINSRKASRSTLRLSDIVPVDIASGERVGPGDEVPSEYHIHREIMHRRPDVGGIVHSHPDFIVTLSIAGHQLLPVTGVGSFLPEDVPVFDDASLINPRERGEAVAALLGNGPAVVLRGHGVVIVGATVEEALARYVCAEENARIQYRASVIGTPRVLRGAEREYVCAQTWTPSIVEKHWNYHEMTARRHGAFDSMDA